MKIPRTIAEYAPLLALAGVLSVVQSARLVATGATGELDSATEHLSGYVLLLWLLADARRRRVAPCHDFGFLLAAYLPASLAWYLARSRGWRGLLVLGPILGLIAAVPAVVPWVVYWSHPARP